MKSLPQDLLDRLTGALPWVNRRTLAALAFAVVFIVLSIWLIPPDHPRAAAYQAAAPSVTPVATQPAQMPTVKHTGPTRTPLPPEYQNNSQQTVGITFFGAALALIVVVGVLLFMPREEQ